MKILQVVHSFIPYTFAGTEVYAYNLSKALAKSHEVHVFFRINSHREKEYALSTQQYDGCTLHSLNHTFARCNSFDEIYLDSNIDSIFGALLDRIKPDVVHIQHLLFLSLGMVGEAKKRGIPVVFTLNDYWLLCPRGQLLKDDLSLCGDYSGKDCVKCIESQLSIRKGILAMYNFLRRTIPPEAVRILKRMYLKLVKGSSHFRITYAEMIQRRIASVQSVATDIDVFIAPSQYLRQIFLAYGFPQDKLIYSRYGIKQELLPQPEENRKRKLRFGFIGTLLPMKGIDILIRAFKGLAEEDVELKIFGKIMPYAGYETYGKELERLIMQDKRIRLMGEVDHAEIHRAFSEIDILVVPSIWPENSPLVIQEAFLFKKPVIASRSGGIPELITDGENGILFEAGDEHALLRAIRLVVEQRELLGQWKHAIPPVKSIEEDVCAMEKLYAGLVSRVFPDGKDRERSNPLGIF
jgi:glycosyltransferase involved in cell wall biosynthesis